MIECHPPRWEICVFLVVCSIIEVKSFFTYTLLNSSFSESRSMLQLTHVSVGSLSLPLVHKHKELARPKNDLISCSTLATNHLSLRSRWLWLRNPVIWRDRGGCGDFQTRALTPLLNVTTESESQVDKSGRVTFFRRSHLTLCGEQVGVFLAYSRITIPKPGKGEDSEKVTSGLVKK